MPRKRAYPSLTPHLLKYLREYGPCTNQEMANALGVKATSVAQRLLVLQAQGLVVRVPEYATFAVWNLPGRENNELPALRVRRTWLRAGQWQVTEKIPRTSVFDTREFTEDNNDG